MKTLMTTTIAAFVAMLTLPALAEGDLTGNEAQGEAQASFKASAIDPSVQDRTLIGPVSLSTGQSAMAQGNLRPRGKTSKTSGAQTYMGFPVENLKSPTGMDGGNRK